MRLSGTGTIVIADAVIHSKVRSRSGIVVAAVVATIVIVGIAAIVAAAIVITAAIVAGIAWRAAEDAAIVGIVAGIVIAVAVAAVVVFGKAVAEDGAAGICGEIGSGITAAAAAAGSQTEHGRAGQSNEFQVLSFHGTNSLKKRGCQAGNEAEPIVKSGKQNACALKMGRHHNKIFYRQTDRQTDR